MAICDNRSITAAADALGVSQSRVSKQLKLMRGWFSDELFVRTADGMEPTSKAMSLKPRFRELIRHFDLINQDTEFNAIDIERDLVVSTTDEIEHFLFPDLIRRIETDAPRSKLVFKALERDYAAKQLEFGSVDLVITLNWHIPEHLKHRPVYTDDFVVIFRKGHPLQQRKLTLERYLSARHLMVSPRGSVVGPIDEALASLGHQRVVSVSTPYFMNANDGLSKSDLITTLQRRTCDELVANYDLVLRPLPFEVPPVNYSLFWHRRFDKDTVNMWFRKLIHEILSD